MKYLLYRESDGLVVSISDIIPTITEGYRVATSDQFKPGDEFTYTIYVNGIDENGNVTSSAMIRQRGLIQEQINQLQVENNQLKQDILILMDALATVYEEILNMQGGTV
ncbi:hypothetical protein FDN13_01315 [Caloramator sp. E03]|uniref:hypothetical protein n=1 Tax=Caloramator sp. E03 TaxID=2576307 RepID=UPI00111066B2|nr:hypothetical protein [Caloramator sp. E03]QCX32443.1 hypothetical protein FDN13_01315 [Caloramator sp. E03]